MMKPLLLAAAIGALFAAGSAQAAGDPVRGKKLYMQCGACHGAQGQGGALGPSLKNIVGKKAAQTPGYTYSPAMKASGLTWTEANLGAFLAAPQAKVKGTKMAYMGMKKQPDLDDLMAHLKTLK